MAVIMNNHHHHHLFFVMHQLWHAKTLEMCCTVIRWSQAAASTLDRQCSLSVIKATSCLAAASSPATTEIQPHPSGTRDCPSVSVSHWSQEHTYPHCLSAFNVWFCVPKFEFYFSLPPILCKVLSDITFWQNILFQNVCPNLIHFWWRPLSCQL